MGYHTKEIEKGIVGHFSKIKEEFEELTDAHDQLNPVLELCELCDLIGAIEAYTITKYNIYLDEIIKMMNCTKEAFQEGKRK